MRDLTLEQLQQIMREVAGPSESAGSTADIGDTPFAELGYDSLVVLETATRVGRRTGVTIPDDVVFTLGTPNEFIAYVAGARAVG
ncbi:acyl carrier protein [Crossiella sp. NPDC003009]